MWVKLDDAFPEHRKIEEAARALGRFGVSRAIAVYVEGLCYAARNLTDGFLSARIVAKLYTDPAPQQVARALATVGLWEPVEGGYQIHDYGHYNPTSQEVKEKREWDRKRKSLYSDPDLVVAIRTRDQDRCRYCGERVNWTDRRGPGGGQFDHVVPRGDNSMSNVVVACRGCNNRKGDRTPKQARMVLLDENQVGPSSESPIGPSSELVPKNQIGTSSEPVPPRGGARRDRDPVPSPDPDPDPSRGTPPPSVSSSNRPPAAADTRRGALSIGSHKAHASCGRPCVPAFLHAEFRQNLGGDEDANDRELRAWYGRVMDEWHGKTIPLDGVKFWRRAFESWQKTEAEEAMWKAM